MKVPVITICGQAKGEVEFADELLVKDVHGKPTPRHGQHETD